MAQHDYDIANQDGAATRADINAALAAIVSQNSGATEPAETFPYMSWADTTAGKLKLRNAADSAWITVLDLASGLNLDLISQAEAEAGSATTARSWSAQRVKQAIVALAASSVQIQPISASVGSNALKISASALSLSFRSTTLGSGSVTTVSGTPSNLIISSGSTLGTVSGQQSDIAVLALNNAGTIELAAVNLAGGTNLDETGLISTTAEGGAGAADSATVVYSATARTNVAYRVIGIVRSTQTTAGTWATAPSLIQGSGGQALTSLQSIGYGQTWQNLVGSRAYGTTYYNTTGRPILVSVANTNATAGSDYIEATVNGVSVWRTVGNGATYTYGGTFIVPPGASYVVTNVSGGTIKSWAELR